MTSSVSRRPGALLPAPGEATVVESPQGALKSAPRLADESRPAIVDPITGTASAAAYGGAIRARTRRRLGTAFAVLLCALFGGTVAVVRGTHPRAVSAPLVPVASAAPAAPHIPPPVDPGEPPAAAQEAPVDALPAARRSENTSPPPMHRVPGTRTGPTVRHRESSDSVFESRE
jgi:hypothetical protein